MTKYRIYGQFINTFSVDIEAKDKDEALELAEKKYEDDGCESEIAHGELSHEWEEPIIEE